MVASAHYGAVMSGYKMLAQGGNAIDAAVAAGFASTVVEPSRAGLGGDLVMLIYRAKTKDVVVINGGGWAPKAATPELYRSRGGLSQDGPLSPVVPALPAALLMAAEKYGTLSRDKLLAPAIELAERGSPVSENLKGVFRSNRKRLEVFPSTTNVWFRDGEPPSMGSSIFQKDLAQTFRRIVAGGRDGFYKGPTAERIVSFLKSAGGVMELEDLAQFAAEETKPLRVRYKGYDVYGVPPPTQGFTMLEALQILEGFDLRAMKHNSPEYIHHIVEALKLAFADREAYGGDPKFVKDIPIDKLLSPEYASKRRSLIQPERSIEAPAPPGDPRSLDPKQPSYAQRAGNQLELSGEAAFPRWIESFTTSILVVDKDRNMVSITASLAGDFGSAMYVDGDGGGFFINNVLARFHLQPGHPNDLAPRKRPRQTLNPVLVTKDGKPFLIFSSPGGDTQAQSQMQFFLNYVEFGMNVQQALEQPYVVTNAYHESWHPHTAGKRLSVSDRISRETRTELARRGHQVVTHSAKGVGSVNAVAVDTARGILMGGSAPSTDGYVIGW
jgi:gamma-glutamyltranspeptidase/glutathione hydrolase